MLWAQFPRQYQERVLMPYDTDKFLRKKPAQWRREIKEMSLIQIAECAFKSSKLRKTLSQNKIVAYMFWWRFYEDESQILVFTPENRRVGIRIPRLPSKTREMPKRACRGDEPLKLSNLKFKKSPMLDGGVFRCLSLDLVDDHESRKSSSYEIMKIFTDALMEFITIEGKFRLEWYIPSCKKMKECFIWKYARDFDIIHFRPYEIPENSDISEFLEFLLTEITAEEIELTIQDDSFVCRTPFKSKELTVTHSSCFSLECFLNMESEDVTIFNSQFTNSDINCLLKKWIDGGLPNLKKMLVQNEEGLGNSRVRFAGIQTSEQSHVRYNRLTGSCETRYIHRTSDNKEAMVFYNANKFDFAVEKDEKEDGEEEED